MSLPALLETAHVTPEQLLRLLDCTTAGAFVWDAREDRVEWSPHLFETLGYGGAGEARYDDIAELLHPEDRAPMAAVVAASRVRRDAYRLELRLRGGDGRYVHFEVNGLWFGPEEREGDLLIGFLRDITDLKTAKVEAARSYALFQDFFTKAPAAVIVKNAEGRYVFANEAAAEFAGCTVVELLSRTSEEVFDAASSAVVKETDARVLEGGETVAWTGELITRSAARRRVLNTKFPITDPTTGARMIGAFVIDVTRMHDMEKLVARAQKMEAIGQLVAGVAHDFNNTLAVMQGSLDILRTDPQSVIRDELFREAQAAVERGARLTQQLLAFGRKAVLEITVFDLNAVMTEMDRLLRRTLPETIQIETVVGGGLWRVSADRSQVENAILNLALNARDAMPNGGRLTIETANVRISDEYVDERREELAPGRYVMLALSDTGIGMSAEHLEHAFEPFFTTKPPGVGTGMGLAMVFGLMRQLKGAARIYSEVGVGTTVKLLFPASEGAAAERAPSSGDSIPGGRERILLAEDDDSVRRAMGRQLRALGYSVVEVENGDAALALIEAGEPFDLLVTDIVMPGSLLGTQLARRARGLRPGIPIVFLSGYPTEASRHGNGLAPSDQLLMKPVTLERLARALRRALDAAAC